MKKWGTLVVGLVLLLALVGAVVLTGKNQDTRKSAYFAGSKLFLLPEQKALKKGEVFPVQLWVETGSVTGGSEKAKVVGVTAYVCYDSTKLSIDESDLDKVIFVNKETSSFNEVPLSLVVSGSYPSGINKCVNLSVTSNKPEKDLSSGVVNVARIIFKAILPGASGEIILDKTKSVVSGNAAGDTTMSIDNVAGLTYTIESDDSSVVSVWPVLKYMISYRDVDVNNMCIANWPVVVTLLAQDGTTKIYPGQVPVLDTSITGRAVYRGALVLTNFPYYENVAVFFKGPKHLQAKYGVNHQTEYYALTGGVLTLTSDPNTTPLYDFSGYSLMPGDVTGLTVGVPDGIVDGMDYSYVKAAATRIDEVADGGYLQTDMDGNCKINGIDTALFKQTLKDKLEQLY